MSTKKGLGKGFGSLLSEDFDDSILLEKKDRTQKLFISDIQPNLDQPRKHFDKDALAELASSIKQFGILQPLVVTPKDDGKYMIIAGERRYRASKLAGISEVPALVRSSEELERLEIGLVENVQRVDLSPLEQAISISKLHEQFNVSYEEIARRLGKAHTTVLNIVRLLQLPVVAKEALGRGDISEGHARAILALKDYPSEQAKLLDLIVANKLSVRMAEQYVNSVKGKTSTQKTKPVASKQDLALANKVSKYVGTKVSINRGGRGGKILVRFASDKELESIIDKIIS